MKICNRLIPRWLVMMLGLFSGTLMAQTATEADPWEGYNRAMFAFNDKVDSVLLKPAAKGYKAITPTPVQKGVSNFFSNLGEISNITNNLLQGKWDQTASSTIRFVVNSTAGWFGIFDVASELGLQKYNEDFGQTLGYWGVSSGPYLVLPLFGSSTLRDTGGLAVDYMNYDAKELLAWNSDERLTSTALNVVQIRSQYLAAEAFVIGDRYTFLRDIYLQSRQRAVQDGAMTRASAPQAEQAATVEQEDSWGDDSWGEDSWDDEL